MFSIDWLVFTKKTAKKKNRPPIALLFLSVFPPSLFLRDAMKLLTHNMLACHIKGVTNNFPLKIEATKVRRE